MICVFAVSIAMPQIQFGDLQMTGFESHIHGALKPFQGTRYVVFVPKHCPDVIGGMGNSMAVCPAIPVESLCPIGLDADPNVITIPQVAFSVVTAGFSSC